MRRALGLLLGGNLGEMALMAGASVAGRNALLTTRQILAVNLGTDVLPALAVAVQGPEHRTLSALAREGAAALDQPLRREIVRRGAATALPSLGAYLLAGRNGAAGRSVAFASLVATQLAQTIGVGTAERRLSGSVAAAVAGSGALLVAACTVPSLRAFLGLTALGPVHVAIVAAACAAAVALGSLASDGVRSQPRALLPAGAT
jgi:magnesium-transporting ATPase (P-type)